MMQLGTQRVGADGHLIIGGCDAVDLAETYSTPLYVLDEACFRANCRAYREALATCCERSQAYYAGKAMLCVAVARLAASEGLGLDVASGGELATALQADLDPELITLHGNFKSDDEMRFAHEVRVGRVVVDHLGELGQWAALAQLDGRPAPVQIRVNPDVKPQTHTAVQVGQHDSKFGLGIGDGQALEALRRAHAHPHLKLHGVHFHIGSQVLGWQAFAAAARQLAGLLRAARDELGVTLDEVNLGGGLGIRYLPEHAPPSIATFVREVTGALFAETDAAGLPRPRVLLEPGRSIVGEAGVTLYRVGPIKQVSGIRTYVSVDGGLSDNPRPEMYGAEYHGFIANRAAAPAETVVTVSGKHCETDALFRDMALAAPQTGDLLAVQSTGAYNYSMASNYNRFPKPAVVLVNDGQAELIVRRETWEEQLRCDKLPARLAG